MQHNFAVSLLKKKDHATCFHSSMWHRFQGKQMHLCCTTQFQILSIFLKCATQILPVLWPPNLVSGPPSKLLNFVPGSPDYPPPLLFLPHQFVSHYEDLNVIREVPKGPSWSPSVSERARQAISTDYSSFVRWSHTRRPSYQWISDYRTIDTLVLSNLNLIISDQRKIFYTSLLSTNVLITS